MPVREVGRVSRRERPQLLFGANGQPEVLYNAVWPNGKRPAFTFAQRIGAPVAAAKPALGSGADFVSP